MRSQGRGESEEWLDHERLGYNYRMDELSAALGCSQMERIEEILDKRAKVAGMYRGKLSRSSLYCSLCGQDELVCLCYQVGKRNR